jgi:hypothetical protein
MTFKTEIWDTSRDTDSLRLLGLWGLRERGPGSGDRVQVLGFREAASVGPGGPAGGEGHARSDRDRYSLLFFDEGARVLRRELAILLAGLSGLGLRENAMVILSPGPG